jgi:hypothetical protein
MSRIFWKDDEWEQLAEVSFSLRNDLTFNGSDIDCVREAMRACIDPSRHRDLVTMSEVPKVVKAWPKLMAQKNAYESKVNTAIKAVVSPEVERQSNAASIADVSIEALFAELGKRMASLANPANLRALIRAEVNATIDRRMPGIIPPDIYDQPEPKQRIVMPKVCVIGLTNGQKSMLREQYKNQVDFHFLEGSEGTQRVKNTARTMDLTVKSRWCKGLLGSTKDFENFQSTTGGIDQIRSMIDRVFKTEAVK